MGCLMWNPFRNYCIKKKKISPKFWAYSVFWSDESFNQTGCSRCGFAKTLKEAKQGLSWWLNSGDPHLNSGIITGLIFGDDWQLEAPQIREWYRLTEYYKNENRTIKKLVEVDAPSWASTPRKLDEACIFHINLIDQKEREDGN